MSEDETRVVPLFRPKAGPTTTTHEEALETLAPQMEALFETMKRTAFDALEREKALVAALEWCSGSSDFGPGGQAHLGWKRVVEPALKASREAAQTVAFHVEPKP